MGIFSKAIVLTAAMFAVIAVLSAPQANAGDPFREAYQKLIDNPNDANRENARAALKNARRDVTRHRAEVRKLKRNIRTQHRWISTLQWRIKAKKRWMDNQPWFKKTFAAPEFAAYAAARNAEISTAYTKIGTMETAKGVALGTVRVTKQSIKLLEKALAN